MSHLETLQILADRLENKDKVAEWSQEVEELRQALKRLEAVEKCLQTSQTVDNTNWPKQSDGAKRQALKEWRAERTSLLGGAQEVLGVLVPYEKKCMHRSHGGAWYLSFKHLPSGRYIPKSVSTLDEEARTIEIPKWLAQKKGLSDE